VTRRTLALLLPLAFLVHNAEEALTIPRFLAVVKARLPTWAPWWALQIRVPLYRTALLVVTALAVLIGLWVLLRPRSHAAFWSLLLLQSVLLLNAFSHLLTVAILRGYSPGVITAVLLNLSLSLYVFRTASRERWLSRAALLGLVPAAVLVHGPLLIALFALLGRRAV
jgi:hypothetical protein